MSRLDSVIRRLMAQRACLDEAARLVADLPGAVLELGLGNGRTYDHLRGLLPDREIFAFDRAVAAHPDCVPDGNHLLLGDFRETLPAIRLRIGRTAVLVHADIGSGDRVATAMLAAAVAPAVATVLVSGGIVVGDQPMDVAGWRPVQLPAGVAAGRYFMYRASP